MNKDSKMDELKNNGITPEAVQAALSALPTNYVVETLKVLDELKKAGKIDKIYSSRYIIKVRKGEGGAFNEDILNALVAVGQKNLVIIERFGDRRKKTSQTN